MGRRLRKEKDTADIVIEETVNSAGYWDMKWRKRHQWLRNKWRYRLLGRIMPRLALKYKPRRKYYRDVAKLAAELTSGEFCDLACGSGATAGVYSVITGRIGWGMDFSKVGIDFAQKEAAHHKARCQFVVGNVYAAPFRDKAFNTVYLGQVLEHLEDDSAALREAIRILEPQGNLIVSVPVKGKVLDPEHVREYGKDDIEVLLRAAGARELAFHDFAMPSRFVIACKKKG